MLPLVLAAGLLIILGDMFLPFRMIRLNLKTIGTDVSVSLVKNFIHMPKQTKKTKKHSSVSNADTDINPPEGWEPSEEDLRQLRECPAYDIDSDLGGEREEKLGEEYLKSFKDKAIPSVPATTDRVLTSKEILSFIVGLRKK